MAATAPRKPRTKEQRRKLARSAAELICDGATEREAARKLDTYKRDVSRLIAAFPGEVATVLAERIAAKLATSDK